MEPWIKWIDSEQFLLPVVRQFDPFRQRVKLFTEFVGVQDLHNVECTRPRFASARARLSERSVSSGLVYWVRASDSFVLVNRFLADTRIVRRAIPDLVAVSI